LLLLGKKAILLILVVGRGVFLVCLGMVFKGRLNRVSLLIGHNTLISSPICPLSKFLDSLKSDLRCPIIGFIAAHLLHSLRFLSR
jgi:hypothetical protein